MSFGIDHWSVDWHTQVLLLMRNLSTNLRSPDFEQHVSYLVSSFLWSALISLETFAAFSHVSVLWMIFPFCVITTIRFAMILPSTVMLTNSMFKSGHKARSGKLAWWHCMSAQCLVLCKTSMTIMISFKLCSSYCDWYFNTL